MDSHINSNKPSVFFVGHSQTAKRITIYFLEIITCDPSICTMSHPDLIVCSFIENSIGLKRGKLMMTLLNYINKLYKPVSSVVLVMLLS